MKRLVLFVEGHGDGRAVSILVGKLLSEAGLFDANPGLLDKDFFRLGSLGSFTGRNLQKWTNYLQTAYRRGSTGAILAVFDGDAKHWGNSTFCVANVARTLVAVGREAGAGSIFSLAVVFVRCEFESWLLASAPSLVGELSNGFRTVSEIEPFEGDLEQSPRDAKRALRKVLPNYKVTSHQAELTQHIDLGLVRSRNMTSFTHLEHAVALLASACQTGNHVAMPPTPTN